MGTKISADANAMFIQCDVAKADQVEAMFDQIKEKWGRLDVMFINAGSNSGIFGRFHELPLQAVNDNVAVNQMGAWHVLK